MGWEAHRVYVLIFQSLHKFYANDIHIQNLCIVANFCESCSISVFAHFTNTLDILLGAVSECF